MNDDTKSGHGFIKLYRSIWDCPFWDSEPFTRAQAWIDLLMLAYHEPKQKLIKNKWVHVPRGSYPISESFLMSRWKWGKEKTRKFLKLLEKGDMIIRKPDRNFTMISIVNYEKYQSKQTANQTDEMPAESSTAGNTQTADPPLNRPQPDRSQTADPPQTKNIKNDKESKRNIKTRHKYGQYQNVLLSDDQLEMLKREFPDTWQEWIEKLSEGIEMHGYSYKNHLTAIRSWARRETKKKSNATKGVIISAPDSEQRKGSNELDDIIGFE